MTSDRACSTEKQTRHGRGFFLEISDKLDIVIGNTSIYCYTLLQLQPIITIIVIIIIIFIFIIIIMVSIIVIVIIVIIIILCKLHRISAYRLQVLLAIKYLSISI